MGFLVLGAEPTDRVAGSTITPSSESSTHPASNIKVLPVGRRTRTLSGALNESWAIDLGAAYKISLACVLGHNLTSNAVVTLKAGPDSGVGALIRNIPWREFDAFTLMPEPQSYQFWQLEIEDTGNPANYLAFGRLLLLDALQLREFNFAFNWKRLDDANNLTQSTPFGVEHVDERYEQVTLTLPFESIPKAHLPTLRNYIKALRGNARAVFVIPDPSEYEGYLTSLISGFEVQHINHAYRDIGGLVFREKPRGIVLA